LEFFKPFHDRIPLLFVMAIFYHFLTGFSMEEFGKGERKSPAAVK
jgi:hypothetical protein